MKKYWFTVWLNEEEVAVKMWQICTVAEYDALYNALWATARNKFKDEVKRRIITTVKENGDNIKARMKAAWWSIGSTKREAEAEKLAQELWINFGNMWKDAIINYYKQS
jgi:hypothetical protein